jgi:photosystem II stability/assembly factor-like uncharacterized protein/molybdopterin converting factor small subunit
VAVIELRPPLSDLAGGAREHRVGGATVGEAIAELEREHPSLAGWVRDEHGRVRRHVSVFVNGRQVVGADALGPEDRIAIVGSISGGEAMPGLLLGTRKGLVVLPGEGAPPSRHFAGQEVSFASADPRTGRVFAATVHWQYGPRIFWSDDPDAGWEECDGPRFPEGTDAAVDRVWIVRDGADEDELWAGVAPAALFRSGDGGRSWELVRPLWDHPRRAEWSPGAGGMCLHSICPWPGDPSRLAVAVSAGGVWLTDDGGASWREGVEGIVARYLPEEARAGAIQLCVHNMHRHPGQPATLYIQFHGGVYRSDDAGETWVDIADGLPSDFGFPMVLDPQDPDRAFVIPLTGDFDRVTAEGRVRVFETRDRGATWTARSDGLPGQGWLTVLRQAFCAVRDDPLALAFGATSGEVFGSIDGGATWQSVARDLPPVLSVRPGPS